MEKPFRIIDYLEKISSLAWNTISSKKFIFQIYINIHTDGGIKPDDNPVEDEQTPNQTKLMNWLSKFTHW